MQLYFLRHGLAADRVHWHGDEARRPLTPEGEERMAREAATLRKLRLGLDRIISSPLTRALQTAQIVAKELKLSNRVVEDPRLAPGFGLEPLAGILRDHGDAGALMLVGHDPDFSDTIGELIGGGTVICKKGALARIDLADPDEPKGELVWLIPPRMLVL